MLYAPSMARSSAKRDAILSIGLDRPTTEILAAAAASGVTVSRAYVDILKKGGGRRSEPKRRGERPAPPASAPAREPAAGADAAFRAAAVRLVLQSGIATAREALDDVLAQIRASLSMA